jgi:hypothetical protein
MITFFSNSNECFKQVASFDININFEGTIIKNEETFKKLNYIYFLQIYKTINNKKVN